MTRHPRAELDQVAEATIAALRAPSILNTQPWRWRLVGDHAQLWADRSRQLGGLDPDGRLLLLSCGAALHHAVTALLAAGFDADITRLPDPRQPDLVACIRQGAPRPPDRTRYDAIYQRHTDRRPFSDVRPSNAVLDELRTAAQRHGVDLHVVRPDQAAAFASAVARAGDIEHVDPRCRADLLTWTNRPWQERDGVVPRSAVPADRRTVPPRDFHLASPPSLDAGPGGDRGTVYALFAIDADEPAGWIAAGEALSDVWLTLTARGLAASPISEVVEVPAVRVALRRLLGGIGDVAIAMRIGIPVAGLAPVPPSARRGNTETVKPHGRP